MQHIGQLLAQHGSDFVVSAYRNLLGRDPEPEGHTAFEARLLSEHDKVQIIRDLAAQCAKSLLQLEGCLANGDKVGLKSAAHKVVGGASMIHAAGLADLARNIETTCDRHEGFNGLDAARLHDAVGEVVAVFGTLTDRNSLERYMSAGNPLAFHA